MTTKKVPFISVIIPARGRANFVDQAIDSVYKQAGIREDSIQIIVVEDDPQMEVKTALSRKYPKITFVQNGDKEGPGGARNTGIPLAKGRYLAFLDSDDIWEENFARTLMASFDDKTICSMCFSKTFFDGKFRWSDKLKLQFLCLIRDSIFWSSYLLNNRNLYKTGFYLPQISHLLFLRSAVSEIRFDYQFRRGGEDWAYFAQCLTLGRMKIVPKRLLKFRYSPGSSTMQAINRQLKWESYRRVTASLNPSFKKGILYKLFLRYLDFGSKGV